MSDKLPVTKGEIITDKSVSLPFGLPGQMIFIPIGLTFLAGYASKSLTVAIVVMLLSYVLTLKYLCNKPRNYFFHTFVLYPRMQKLFTHRFRQIPYNPEIIFKK